MTSMQVIAVAAVVMALAMVAFVAIGVTIGLKLQRSEAAMAASLVRLRSQIAPLIENAITVSENLKYISGSLRGDVRRIASTVSSTNERVHQAVSATERRLKDFNALLSVVQDEAEDLFVATASTVEGVRRGAASLAARDGMDLASEELDAVDTGDIEPEEDGHGDDSDTDQPEEPPAAPRVRPRARGRRGRGHA
jgi:hypothetical protein